MGSLHLVVLAVAAKNSIDGHWLAVPVFPLLVVPFEPDNLLVFLKCLWGVFFVNLIGIKMALPKVIKR